MDTAAAAVSLAPAPRPSPARLPEVTDVDLAVAGLWKSFDGRTVVLKDIAFDIRHRQAVALIGANGTGKSTLLRCCVRLIEPDRGSVRLFGEELMGMGARRLRHLRARVGVVFQRHHLVPRLSVFSNVLHGALPRGSGPRVWFQSLARHQERERVLHCLDLVGLAPLAERRVDQLSGGESQRVAVARALMQAPRIMVADEPVASRTHTRHLILYYGARMLISLFRTVPDLVWALFFVVSVGLGPFAGALALMVDTIGFCGRFFAEAMEEVDKGPQEALRAVGARRSDIVMCTVVPAAVPSFINTGLFSLEKATRSSVVLGLVGAGGIGIELKVAMDMFQYDQAATIMLLIFALVVVVEQISAAIRRQVI